MNSIGMIVPTVDNSFFAALASCVERTMRGAGYRVVVCGSDNDVDEEKALFRHLTQLGVKGILCVSGLRGFPEELADESLPLVWVDRVPESRRGIPWVANDDSAAMQEATQHLIDTGCRSILLMPGFLAEEQESPRVAGYKAALQKNGLAYDPRFVLNRKGERSSEAESEQMVRDLLRQGIKIDGIITASDRAAFGAMAGLRSVGLYVPEDVRLISFDNSPYSTMATPSVTALDRNPEALAQKACQILLARMTGMHTALATYMLAAFATVGWEGIVLTGMIVSNIDLGVACLIVALKSKNTDRRATALGCGITATLSGIVEPGLFGVALPLRTPLYGGMIGTLFGGAVAGLLKAHAYVMTGAPGLLGGLPIYLGGGMGNFTNMCIAVVVGAVITAVATMFLYKEPAE